MKNPYPKKLRRVPAIATILTVILSMATGCHAKEQAPTGTTGSPTPPEKDTITALLLTERRYYDRSGELFATDTYTYDDRGLLLSYEETGHREARITNANYYTYNEHGHLTSYTQEHSSLASPIIVEYTYTYNENGTVASFTPCEVGKSPSPTEYLEYDEQGRFLKITMDNKDGGRRNYIVCSYNEDGTLASYDTYEYDASFGNTSEPSVIQDFTYDDRGNLTAYKSTIGFQVFQHDYEYDDDGNLIREGERWQYFYTDGILSGIKYNPSSGSTEPKRSYSLDDTGHVTKLVYSDGSRVEYQYETRELSRQEMGMSRLYLSVTYDAFVIFSYLDDILCYFLPKPKF